MPATIQTEICTVGIDIGKNSFHIIGLDDRCAIVLRREWSRGQLKGTQPERLPVQFCMNPTRPKKVEVAATAPSTTFKPSGASGSGAGPAITSAPFLGLKEEPWQEQTNAS